MDVTCPACAARYTADEQKLRGKTARMRCKACDTVWLVSGPEDKMNEEKRAAVVKRGADRDHRDLFASRPADLGSVKQTLRPPPGVDFGGVAARNETSVLFTVDSLKGAARVKTPAPELAPLSSAFIAQDDEGVIDLKALASQPPRAAVRSVAPLFSEPPPAAFAADVDGPFSSAGAGEGISMPGGFKLGKRAMAGIAAAAVALVLCSVGLAAAFKGEEPVAHTAANAIMAPVTPPAPVVVAPAAPVIAPVAASNASSSSDEDTKSSTVSKGKGKKGKGGAKASFSGTKVQSSGVASKKSSSSDALVSKPAPKAADKCGCKGDFNCILRCTAKGS
ncbi:MAG: hypothetical protein JWO86_4045 [Myxococcaceae bacterium]|nr:hypothetical protein [Myxococcaceae bacterium]MEA2752951.1 hypothetical protein [Myxococcales bacterium]